jgi:uncharacterized protein YdeI (YjbR/CyaY-like superfamily)
MNVARGTPVAKSDDPLEVLYDMDRADWRRWLKKNHDSSTGVRLAIFKKGSGKLGVTYEEAVEEALCFGWIDGRLNAVDEERFKLHFSSRRPSSYWSRSNKERVQRLIEKGLMTPAGLAKIEIAKKNGNWDIIDDVENLRVPDDLEKALSVHPPAKENFEAFGIAYKKQALWWIKSAKRPETRARRVEETTLLAAENKKAYQYMRKDDSHQS